jgi:chromate transporter
MARVAPGPLKEVAGLFLKLGIIGFGGPAAHIAMMEDEVVRRRGWLSREKFIDLLGATNLVPGPNSTEMAIHIGRSRAGFPGLFVAGACFILPAVAMATACAWAYTRFGALPQTGGILYGVKPVIIAVVFQALWGLGRTAVKSPGLAAMGIAAAALSFLGVNELLLLFASGVLAASVHRMTAKPEVAAGFMAVFKPSGSADAAILSGAAAGAAGGAAVSFGLWPMFLFFLKVGSVLYGSGYVLLAFLRSDLVERWGWLSEAQLLDAVAVGQATPGPVFTTATFIGYVLGGAPGAAVATAGIFFPAFFFVAVSGPLVPRIRRSPVAGAFLDGVNVASLALMAAVTWRLGAVTLVDGLTILLALGSAILLLRFRLNSTWLILGGAVVGLVSAGWRTTL